MNTEQHLHLLIGQLLVQIAMLRAELDALKEQQQEAARHAHLDGARSG